MRTKPCNGFTLVEILATVGIIALLAALLFPSFKRTMVNARAAKSMQNMRTIGMALQSYAQDNNNTYPVVAAGAPLVPWCRNPLDPYLPMMPGNSENAVFSCPNASSPNKVKVRRAYSAGGAMYGISGASRAQNTSKGRNLLTIRNLNRAVLIFDSVVRTSGLCRDGTDWESISQDLQKSTLQDNAYIDYRQNNRANFYFADHHIESLSPEDATKTLPDSRTYEGM